MNPSGPPPPPPPVGGGSNNGGTPPTTTTTTTAPPPPAGDNRALNVKDALSYLDQVKLQFNDQPEVYNRFLDIMKEFKSQAIDTPGVIERVSTLFRGHPNLITGFNYFLPPGYRIEATNNPANPFKVTVPTFVSAPGVTTAAAPAPAQQPPVVVAGSAPPPPPPSSQPSQQQQQQSWSSATSQPMPTATITTTNATSIPPPPTTYGIPMSSVPPQRMGSVPPQPAPPAATAAKSRIDAEAEQLQRRAPVEFNHAINYVNKIKNRFANDPETYKQFLEILQTYQKEQKPIHEVYAQVQILFKDAPDLLAEFKQFLPDNSQPGSQQQPQQPLFQGMGGPRGVGAVGGAQVGMPVLQTLPNGMAVPQVAPPARNANFPTAGGAPGPATGRAPTPVGAGSGKGKGRGGAGAGRKDGGVAGKQQPQQYQQQQQVQQQQQREEPPKKKIRTTTLRDRSLAVEEIDFFDKARRTINNKATYNEFLKIVNLFSQDIIDAKTLVEKSEPFLGKNKELLDWLKRYLKYEDEEIIYNVPSNQPAVDLRTCRRSGHSYRLLPSHITQPKCTGRDSLCREVLNDTWVSHPIFTSEDTGFVTHKKNPSEEAWHKVEEERYEFDMNIEANLHTIALLEPIAKKINAMTPEERAKFKLPVGLGGSSKTIYQRVIRKVYDRERGNEIIEALHNHPAVAVPVVLRRLKQKDEEWKRAQREWNKVWRDIENKNFYKALDYQTLNFKANDKKILTIKNLVTEIETVYREQRERKALTTNISLPPSSTYTTHIPTLGRYQFDFGFKDLDLFRDTNRLIMYYCENGANVANSDYEKVEMFLKGFMSRVFFLDAMFSQQQEQQGGNVSAGSKGVYGDDEDDDETDQENESASSVRQGNDVDSAGELDVNGEDDRAAALRKSRAARREARRKNDDSSMEMDDENGNGEDVVMTESQSLDGKGEEKMAPVSATARTKDVKTPVRPTYVLYGNNGFYAFFRLYQLIYSRLAKMKELAQEIVKIPLQPPQHFEKPNPSAVELGLQQRLSEEAAATLTTRNYYNLLLKALRRFFKNVYDQSEFEETVRAMFGTSSYLVFTMDKVVQTLIKQITSMMSDPRTSELMDLFFKDREKDTTSPRQEAVYRLSAESLIPDENIYRLEYFVAERVLTIQLLGKDDYLSDHSITSEERWSLYVDHFVQLNATEGVRLRRREPFLKRTLPSEIPDTPPTDIESYSGLELKICVNTYKIFFVDNTEDYFRRVKKTVVSATQRQAALATQQRVRRNKFEKWLEGAEGWKRGLGNVGGDASERSKAAVKADQWLLYGSAPSATEDGSKSPRSKGEKATVKKETRCGREVKLFTYASRGKIPAASMGVAAMETD